MKAWLFYQLEMLFSYVDCLWRRSNRIPENIVFIFIFFKTFYFEIFLAEELSAYKNFTKLPQH